MKPLQSAAVLCSAILAAALTFGCLISFDNRYSWPGPRGEYGVTDLVFMDDQPFVFLVHGWEVYEDRLLTPQELGHGDILPDRYVYIGQYGGFEFGDRTKEPRGSATYRMRLLLDAEERQYCLELPEIFSSYCLWINGKPVKTMGDSRPKSYRARTQISSQEFRASGETELVLWVSNYTGFYSGLTYPPAFGTPEGVRGMQNIYLITHTIAVFFALFLGITCLVGRVRRGVLFLLLCCCYGAYTGYPLFHTLGFEGLGWYLGEKIGLYAMLLVLAILAGSLAGFPAFVQSVMFGAGNMVCLLVLTYPLIPVGWDAGVMHLYSNILFWWKWIVALYLLLVSTVIMKKGVYEAELLSWGMLYFGFSLGTDGLLPLFEPVYTGWPPELGGFLMILSIGGVLILNNRQEYQRGIRDKRLGELARQELDAQKKYSEMLTAYLERTGKRNHEFKKNLELMGYYLKQQDYRRLGEYLTGLKEQEEGVGMPLYTVNPLINSIMATRCATAEKMGIETRFNLLKLPRELAMEDGELCSLLTNLLDNAIEGAGRLKEGKPRWIRIGMELKGNSFSVLVENSALKQEPPNRGKSSRRTQKGDFFSHGYGLGIISEIVKAYNGIEEVRWENDVYLHHVILFLGQEGK